MLLKAQTAGYGLDTVYYWDTVNARWIWKSPSDANYYMSATVGIPRRLSGYSVDVYPEKYSYNGQPVYLASNGLYVWYRGAVTASWVMTNVVGYLPATIGGVYPYNWYLSTSSISGINGNFVGQLNSDTKTFPARPVAGYYCSTLTGVYAPVSGVGDSMYVGWRKYTMSDGANSGQLCELDQLSNLFSVFAFLAFMLPGPRTLMYCWKNADNKWTISTAVGNADPLVGYWQQATAADAVYGTYSRVYTGSGTAPLPATYTVNNSVTYSELLPTNSQYDGIPDGNTQSTTPIYTGEVALWL